MMALMTQINFQRDMVQPTHSMCASVLFVRDEIGVRHACLGVDIQAARPAPVGKRFGVDEGAHNDVPFSAFFLLETLGFVPPFDEAVGDLVAIGHDPSDGVVIFGQIPGNADGAGCFIDHGDSLYER
jgi:hypothetical protein